MKVIVEKVDGDVVKVNGQLVVRDMNENWIAKTGRQPEFVEKMAFRSFLQMAESCPNLVRAEYKYGNS